MQNLTSTYISEKTRKKDGNIEGIGKAVRPKLSLLTAYLKWLSTKDTLLNIGWPYVNVGVANVVKESYFVASIELMQCEEWVKHQPRVSIPCRLVNVHWRLASNAVTCKVSHVDNLISLGQNNSQISTLHISLWKIHI